MCGKGPDGRIGHNGQGPRLPGAAAVLRTLYCTRLPAAPSPFATNTTLGSSAFRVMARQWVAGKVLLHAQGPPGLPPISAGENLSRRADQHGGGRCAAHGNAVNVGVVELLADLPLG